MDGGRVLVIDDDPTFSTIVTVYLSGTASQIDTALTGAAGVEAFERGDHDVVLLDLGLPGGEGGLEVLRALRAKDAARPIIILTADTSVASIVTAMRDGAWDYLSKPIERTKLQATVRNAVERRRLMQRVDRLSRHEGTSFHGIIGGSAEMRRLFAQIERVARSDVTVAIHGESGSGKELVARALHDGSPRKNGPFVGINCAAIPESLQESEFFGHEKGSFTGAVTRRVGHLEQADGGTLFLDEVAELSLTLQAKLLRSLQERSFSRVGGSGQIVTNFRLLTATHKDLVQEVAAGRFREDLYYRLAVFDLALPPLRNRRDDIPLLTQHFLQQQCGPAGVPFRLDEAALNAMMAHHWRGNVRELQNAIYHSLVLANDGVIRVEDLPLRVRDGARHAAPRLRVEAPPPAAVTPAPQPPPTIPDDAADVAAVANVTEVTGPAATADVMAAHGSPDELAEERRHGANAAVEEDVMRAGALSASSAVADDFTDEGDEGEGVELGFQVVTPPHSPERALPVMTLDALERRAIEEAVTRNGGNLSAVAKELGLGRTTLYRKLQAYGGDRPPET
jgi:DNA-binding NtrC family response regulator